MLRIALTGGIACGKSMAEQLFRDCGCAVLDADKVVADLEAPGGEGVAPIVRYFGSEVCAPDGGIDKRLLGEKVFADAQARTALEQILHPLIRTKAEVWMDALPQDAIALFSAALLFECGWAKDWPYTVCVTASPETQLRRMMEKRGLSEAAARARLAAQMPVDEKARLSRWVIHNDTDEIAPLAHQIKALVTLWKSHFNLGV